MSQSTFLMRSVRTFEAPTQLVPLSLTNDFGIPLIDMNLWKAIKNDSVDMLDINSKCTALYSQHVNTTTHTLRLAQRNGPAQSIPVDKKGAVSSSLGTLKSGKGAMTCLLGFGSAFWHDTQFLK